MTTAQNKENDVWTPILSGDVYCSPACGLKCTKSAYDRAVTEAEALAKRMGDGWSFEVWENCGWHYRVKKGTMTIHTRISGRSHEDDGYKINGYWVDFHPTDIQRGKYTKSVQFSAEAETPEDAVGFCVQDVRNLMHRINDALLEVSE